MDKSALIKEKAEILNRAAKAYYQEDREVMSNYEYDRLYDELKALEEETGIILSTSPTQKVGYQVLSDLPKEAHAFPMLSLDKTKDTGQLADWLGEQKGILSWKIDGITVVLSYKDGALAKAVTRGNGEIGEVITNNAKVFENLPITIPHKRNLVLRGEAFIKYSDFEKINQGIEDMNARYKNPRNLTSGSVRQLDNSITAQRKVNFCAFSLVTGVKKHTREEEFLWLKTQGFQVVEYEMVTDENLKQVVERFAQAVPESDMPTDGLVLLFDDIAYGQSLGATSKFPRDSIAFKWQDETKETVLKEIEWSASRTGLINPVAVFEPVELEGTTVSRASVHNISIVKELRLGIGDRISVYKANMIIPQVAENLSKSDSLKIPDTCPVCHGKTVIQKDKDVEVLYCSNPECLAKQLKSFTHFVGRNAMNIDGLSEATLEKFVAKGYLTQLADLFQLERYKEEIIAMEGLGEKSFANLVRALQSARDTTPARLLYSLGIPGIGVSNAKTIAKACQNQWDKMQTLNDEELSAIDGIGEVMATAYAEFFHHTENQAHIGNLLSQLNLDQSPDQPLADNLKIHLNLDQSSGQPNEELLAGKTFVITGSLNHFDNRDALKALIEHLGGKTTDSVTTKTTHLINNNLQSTSSKNKKAKALNIPIITEEEFLALLKAMPE